MQTSLKSVMNAVNGTLTFAAKERGSTYKLCSNSALMYWYSQTSWSLSKLLSVIGLSCNLQKQYNTNIKSYPLVTNLIFYAVTDARRNMIYRNICEGLNYLQAKHNGS